MGRGNTLTRQLRKRLGGYKPDISIVASALIKAGSDDPDHAVEAVRQYVLDTFSVPEDEAHLKANTTPVA